MGILSIHKLRSVLAQRRARVCLIDYDAVYQAGEGDGHCAASARFHPGKSVWLDLQVPGVIGFPPFQNGAGGRNRLAASFDDHPVKVGRLSPIEGVAFIYGLFIGLETGDAVGARAQRGRILLFTARGGRADTIGELGPADDWRSSADEGLVRIGYGHVEGDFDGPTVDGPHRDNAVK